jgi:hypothetical protein
MEPAIGGVKPIPEMPHLLFLLFWKKKNPFIFKDTTFFNNHTLLSTTIDALFFWANCMF